MWRQNLLNQRNNMYRQAIAGIVLGLAGPALGQTAAVAPALSSVIAPVVVSHKLPSAPAVRGITPNNERDVVIGAIDKRTGLTRNFGGKPGQAFDFGTLRVTVRTCEVTPPWEQKLTGAFVLIDERNKSSSKRVYSGWMFAESPSLHPLEHPRYDIWVKSCTMRFPETGPDTVSAGRADTGPATGAAKASNAKKSAAIKSAPAN